MQLNGSRNYVGLVCDAGCSLDAATCTSTRFFNPIWLGYGLDTFGALRDTVLEIKQKKKKKEEEEEDENLNLSMRSC